MIDRMTSSSAVGAKPVAASGITSLLIAAATAAVKPKMTGPKGAGLSAHKTVAVALRPLTDREKRHLFAIAHTDSILTAIITSFAQSKADGLERGFFIYQDRKGGYYPGEVAIGIGHELPTLAAKHKPRNALIGHFDDTIAYYHTHSGNYPDLAKADDADQNFGRYYRAFVIIQSIYGFTIGGY